jgi:hypothetical protein
VTLYKEYKEKTIDGHQQGKLSKVFLYYYILCVERKSSSSYM